ncbi:MAG: hypothetical protein FJ213_02950 [Ignavibacteria bacterium]|nr:hypothetical protein [Ignavibacteria bacterium]
MSKKGVTFLADALILVICLVGFYHVWQKAGRPMVFYPNSLIIEKVYSARFDVDVFNGEKVLSVNEYKIDTQEDLEFILDGLNIGDKVDLEIVKNGDIRFTELTLIPFYNLRYLIPQILLGLFFFVIADFVFAKRSFQIEAIVFHWIMMSCTVMIFTTWGNYSSESNAKRVHKVI